MSKTEKEKREVKKQDEGQAAEKIVTRYDRKMQRREEEKKKELRDKRMGRIACIVLIAAVVCIAASFPIRTWMNLNGTYIKVNGEKITKVEYDFNYNTVSSNFIKQYYTTYLYYFGIDLSGDLSSQMYSDTLTWKDHFDELTVERLVQNKNMLKEAREEGFVYDTAEEYRSYMDDLKEGAKEAGTSAKEYIRQLYGSYATEARVKPYVEEALYLSAYSEEVLQERYAPSGEEIQEYYENNKASYDSVDYYLYTVNAELPTEPTDLADPAPEEEEGQEAADGEDSEKAYEPSEAEIEAAMEKAKQEAEKVQKTIKTKGELSANMKRSAITYSLQTWLFEEGRKAGDTTVIEDSTNHRYYVLGFEDRYLDKSRSADARILMISDGDGQAILDEWKSGAATEESFGEICDKYRDPSVNSAEGGLYEGLVSAEMPEELREWVFDSGRQAGDTAVISPEGGQYTYVAYYVAPNEEEWYLSIRSTLLSQRMQEYMNGLLENADVQDPKKNLNYLKVLEDAAANAQESGSEESDGDSGSESGSGEGSADSGDESDSGEGSADSGDESDSGESGADS